MNDRHIMFCESSIAEQQRQGSTEVFLDLVEVLKTMATPLLVRKGLTYMYMLQSIVWTMSIRHKCT